MEKTRKLFVGLLGLQNSGKSTTWDELFDGKTKTGRNERDIKLFDLMWESVFLVNGSPEESNIPLSERPSTPAPRILLSSLQYIDAVESSLNYIHGNYEDVFIMWLNPGHKMKLMNDFDSKFGLQLLPKLLKEGATVCMRDAKNVAFNAEEIRAYIHGWAVRNLEFERK